MVKVVSGTSKHHYLIGGDGNSIFGAGVSTGTTTSARFQYGSSGETSHMEFKTHPKSSTVYSTVSGMPSSYNTWPGKRISSSEFSRYLDIVKAEDGSLRQIWNLWDGVANTENISENGYSIALYLPNQVGAKDNSTGLYQLTGEPFKSFDIGPNEERDRIIVTEQASGRPPYVVSWWQTGGAWSMSKGTGEDEIVTLVEREKLGGNRYRLTTKVRRGMEGEVVSCTSETFTKTDEGTLRNDKTMGYGGCTLSKISYSYDDAGRTMVRKRSIPSSHPGKAAMIRTAAPLYRMSPGPEAPARLSIRITRMGIFMIRTLTINASSLLKKEMPPSTGVSITNTPQPIMCAA